MYSEVSAEQAVLGAILLENLALHSVTPILEPTDFVTHTHRDIYTKMQEMSAKSEPIDTTTLALKGFPVDVLISLVDSVATAANIEHYARLVKEASQKKRLSAVSEKIKQLSESTNSAEDCVLEAEKLVLSIRSSEVAGRTRALGDLGKEIYEIVEQRMEEGSGFFGHRTGLTGLDQLMGGLQDGETLVIAGRPSMGKSSVATQILLNRAVQGAHCAFFSLEMSHHMCAMRMLAQLSGIPMAKIKTGQLRPEALELVKQARDRFEELKIWVDDTGAISVPKIRAVCRRIKAESGRLDLVVVDYLQLCGGTTLDGRERDVAEASAGIKALAKEFEMPAIVLSQLNRSCEARDDKRPRLADLRESGAIEQDADGVIMAYRPAVYDQDADPHVMELIGRKSRNGPLGSVSVDWDPECMSVSDY